MAERMVRDNTRRSPHPWCAAPGAAWAVRTAWVAVVLLSAVPAILGHQLWGVVPSWIIVAQAAVVGLLLLCTLGIARIRPLWRFGVASGALLLLTWAWGNVSFALPALQSLFGGTPFDGRMQAEQTGRLAVALSMIGVMLVLGLRPGQFFLGLGQLTAPIRPVRVLGFPKADPWPRFGLIWGFGIAGALGVVQYLLLRPDPSAIAALWPAGSSARRCSRPGASSGRGSSTS